MRFTFPLPRFAWRVQIRTLCVPVRMLPLLCAMLAPAALAGEPSPYVGQEQRQVKALSQAEVEGYLTGAGMGFAKAAELNHYPGPRHVLDLAQELALTADQAEQTQQLYASMRARAVALGRQLVAKEQALDRLFADGTIDEARMHGLLSEIATLRADLRHVHLSAHLKQKALLTRHQVMLYDTLRGYQSGTHRHEAHGKGH